VKTRAVLWAADLKISFISPPFRQIKKLTTGSDVRAKKYMAIVNIL
jgi:hypothetical protein